MCYQTTSKRSPPFWLLIGARKLVFFWHQSEARTATTVWNWSGIVFRGSSGRSLLSFVPYFSACLNFALPLLSAPGSPRMSLQQEEKPKKKKRSKDKDRNKFTALIRRCNATLTETIKQARLGEFVKELFFDISGENEIEIMNKLFISLTCLRVRDIIFRLRVVPH